MAGEEISAQFRALVEKALSAQGFMRLVGAKVDDLGLGRCVLSVEYRPELAQQNGFYHGGVIAFLIDNATATAAGTLIKDWTKETILTAEYKPNIVSPAMGPRLYCRAEVLKPGRTLTVVEGKVYAVGEDGREKLVAAALATIATVPRERVAVMPEA